MKFNSEILKTQIPPSTVLKEWRWLIGEGERKIEYVFITGDAILSDDQGKIYMLNTALGTYTKIADSISEYDEKIRDDEYFDTYIIPPMLGKFLAKIIKEKPLSDDYVYHVPAWGERKYTREVLAIESIWPMSMMEHFLTSGENAYKEKVHKDRYGSTRNISLDKYFSKIRQELVRLIPRFEKIWVSAREDSSSSEIRIFYKQEGKITEAQDIGNLKEIFLDLWDVCTRNPKKRWMNATFILTPDGKYTIEYDGYDSHSLMKMDPELYINIWKGEYMKE